MKINCIQRILLFIFLCVFLFISKNGFTYSASKHHRHMGVRAADESSLDRYLKDNLGFSRGINTTLTNPDEPEGEQTKKIFEWIGYGAAEEDDLFPIVRVVYHFYDPVSNLGLSDYAPFLDSSLVWGNDAPLNDYSWSDTREYYYLALTSRTKEEREKHWALTFRALGQVLHLVQDLASPAHVRNDNHPSGVDDDPYESTWGTSPEGISFIHAILAHGALGNPGYQYPVVELDQFDDYWDTGDGRGLAEFTNSNFVSKDTNLDKPEGDPHHYDNPQATGEYREPFTFTDSTGRTRTIGVNYVTSNVVDNYAPGRSVNPFNYLTTHSFFNFYTERYDLNQRSYTLNRKCHEEYAKLLVPRTVGYGAGLLNYFFRGELNVRTEIDIIDARLVFYVAADGVDVEDLYNNIEIYTEDIDGLRTRIEEDYPIPDNFQRDIVHDEIRLKIDIYNNPSVKFLLVYRGPVSDSEEGEIVIGKVVNIMLGVPTLDNDNYYLEKNGVAEEWDSTYSNTRDIAYQNFINNFPEPHVYWWTPETFIVRIDGGGISYDDQHHAADQLVWRGYVGYDFSFFQDKTVDRVLLVLIWSAPDANLVVYRDSSNTWPPIWGGGDVFLFSPVGPFYEGRYRSTNLIELPLDILNLSGPNVFEARYIDDTLNWIPPAPGEDGRGWSGTLIEIIFYSEEDGED